MLHLISHKYKSFIGGLKCRYLFFSRLKTIKRSSFRFLSHLDCYMFYIKDKLSVCVSPFLSSTEAWKADLSSLCLIRQYDTDSLPWDQKARTWRESKIPDFLQPLSTQCDFTAWYFKVGNMLCCNAAAADVYINRKIFQMKKSAERSVTPRIQNLLSLLQFPYSSLVVFFYLAQACSR